MKLAAEQIVALDKVNSAMEGWDAGYAAGKRAGALAMRERAVASIPGGSICDPQVIADTIRALEVDDE